MKNTKAIKSEVIKREVNLVNTIQSVSLQTGGSAAPGSSATPGGSGRGANGGAIDWKKKYKEEFDKRFAIEEQYDDLQTQVKTRGHFNKYTVYCIRSLANASYFVKRPFNLSSRTVCFRI